MITISLCMIVRNEADVLKRCLDSVKHIADEIIIVDTGSTDKTKEIAADYTDKIYDFTWVDDFAAARNYAFDQATKDYQLWLDADDVLEPRDAEKLLNLKGTLDGDVDLVYMRYHTGFDEDDNVTFTYDRERLFKRAKCFRWVGRVHEVVVPRGKTVRSDIAVAHRKIGEGDPNRNLRIFEKMLAEGETLEPRMQYYYARELKTHERYDEAIEAMEAFLNQDGGWVENKIECCRDLAACYNALGKPQAAFNSLYRSFLYDRPRSETCCDIGRYYMEAGNYHSAIFWYELAASGKTGTPNGFTSPDCYNYIPYLQLCVCYDRLGEYQRAYQYNEMAAAIKPHDAIALKNRTYFDSRNLPDAQTRKQ